MEFYEKFEKLLKDNNKKIKDVSDATGIPYTSIDSIIRRQQKHIQLDVAFKLAHFFGVPIEYLADDDETVPMLAGIPKELRDLNVEYIRIARELQKTGIPSGDLLKIIEAIKTVKTQENNNSQD
jgi:transcriptional regulator with XRE-family HTH domain